MRIVLLGCDIMKFFRYFVYTLTTSTILLCGGCVSTPASEYTYKEDHYQDYGIVTYRECYLDGPPLRRELRYKSVVTWAGIQHIYTDAQFYNFYAMNSKVAIDCCDYYKARVDPDALQPGDYELYRRDFSLTPALK
jgi:hypothetical protein